MLPIRRHANRELPPPAIASSSHRSPSGSGGRHKKATFDDDGFPGTLKVHWSRFVKRLGAGSAISESLIEITESNTGSESATHKYIRGGGAAEADDTADDEEVDETVVDNDFWKSVATKSVTQPSEHAPSPEKSGASGTHMTTADGESLHDNESRLAVFFHLLTAIFYRVKSGFNRFFFTAFYDANSEAQYRRETYYQAKSLAIWGSLFLVINWVSLSSPLLLHIIDLITCFEGVGMRSAPQRNTDQLGQVLLLGGEASAVCNHQGHSR